jgi:molecular chaperone GrpE
MNDRTNGAPGGPGAPSTPAAPGAPGEPAQPRHRTRAEERIANIDTSAASLAAQLQELRERAERAEREAVENKAAWQRSAADFTNYRRRTEQQREEELGLANEMLLLKLLNVADDFARAIAHVPDDQRSTAWVEGIGAIDRKLGALLESEGVSPMPEAEGRPFDPREQEAISAEETSEVPDGSVLRELQRGYRIRDRVLRPSLVTVARNYADTGSAPTSTTTDSGSAPGNRE